jgi:uncharacterized protein
MDNLTKLTTHLSTLAVDGLCVAFSGGVDSTVVLKAAMSVTKNVHAVTLATPFSTVSETEQAGRMAKEMGVTYAVVHMDKMPDVVLANPPDRCYHCKKEIFRAIQGYAAEHNLKWVLDGTHADALTVYRPGLQAIKELGVRSPLAEVGFHKEDVRAVAAELGLAVAEKPAAPCLATRIPYHTTIDIAALPKIDAVDVAVKSLGVPVVRARLHGDTIRLEVAPEYFNIVIDKREFLLSAVKDAGFDRLTLDLAGYQSGSFDKGRT